MDSELTSHDNRTRSPPLPKMPATSSKTIRSLEPEQSAKDREKREAEREEEEENGDAWSDETPFIIVKGVSRIPKSRLGLAAD